MQTEIKNFKEYLTQVVEMDDSTFELSKKYLKIEKIRKGDFLIKEGQICKKIAFVDKGLFRVYYLKDGIEINNCFCLENSITCSFMSLVNQTPATENIQALEDSMIITLSYDSLNYLCNISMQWQAVRLLFTEKECFRLSERANTLSFETALEKYQNLLRFQPELIQRISIKDLASYIGVSRETLSRIRAKV